MEIAERIKVTFHPDKNTQYSYWLPDVVDISEATINKDMVQHSSKYLWFSTIHARLMAKRDHISGVLKTLKGQVEMNIRRDAETLPKKPTEASIKTSVDMDTEVMIVGDQLAEAEAELTMCAMIKDAFYHRQSMLVALGAMLRQEMHSLQAETLKG